MYKQMLVLYVIGMLFAFGVSMPYVKYKYPEESGWSQFARTCGGSTFSWLIVGAAIGDILVDAHKTHDNAEISK